MFFQFTMVLFFISMQRLMQCCVTEDGLLSFITDLPELPIDEPQEKEVLQESSNSEQTPNDGGNATLKSVLSGGKTQSVTFKENLKPREQNREATRSQHQKETPKERRDFTKGNATAAKTELKRDGKKKNELKKTANEKASDASKQVMFLNVAGLQTNAIPFPGTVKTYVVDGPQWD